MAHAATRPDPTLPSRRQFIRHPAEVPLEVRLPTDEAPRDHASRDVGHGGLAFASVVPLPQGTAVQIRIPSVSPPFEARAEVAWCREEGEGTYRIGVRFVDAQDAFRARMVEQVCAIETHRREAERRTGRPVSGDEAAREWIGRHAEEFPDPDAPPARP